MSTASRGAVFEHKIKRYLEQYGWTVFRSAGSHSCADLIAFKEGNYPIWVQCKASSKLNISPKERNAMLEGERYLDIIALCVCKGARPSTILWHVIHAGRFTPIKEPSWLKT